MPCAGCCTDHRPVHCIVTFTFKPHPKTKGLQTKKWKRINFVTQGSKTSSSHVTGKTSLFDNCRAFEKNSGSRSWRPYNRKPQLMLLASLPENTKTGLTSQIRKSKSCLKRNAPATIVCLQNLMIKLPRLHTTYKTACSMWLDSGQCRMIGGQHLLTGHNAMLTITHWQGWHVHLLCCLWILTLDPSPSVLFGQKYPADRQKSHPPEYLGGLFMTNALWTSDHWPRFPKWMWSWSWMIHPLMKRSRKPQCSWKWPSHLVLIASKQKYISSVEKQCLIKDLFTNCWEKGTSRAQWCSHYLSIQKQGRKVRLSTLPRHRRFLHCGQSLGSHLAE